MQTFDPQPDGYTLILNNTLTFATGWNARAQLFRDRSQGRIGVMLPAEGTVRQLNMINLVAGARRTARPPSPSCSMPSPPGPQAAFTEAMFYGATNPTAQVSPNAAARSGAEARASVIPLDWAEMVRLRDGWTQRWRREVIAAGSR